MNEPNFDYLHDAASISFFERLLTTSMPQKRLLPLVEERVKFVITRFIEHAPMSASAFSGNDKVLANAINYLRRVSAIPLQTELCTLMARVGFDKDLFTYGNINGIPVGYAEGQWLLEFVGLTDKNEPMARHHALCGQAIKTDASKNCVSLPPISGNSITSSSRHSFHNNEECLTGRMSRHTQASPPYNQLDAHMAG